MISALHTARESLDEEAPRKAEGDDGGQQIDECKCGQQAVIDLVDAQEGAEETGNNEWLASLTGLIDRLNPDVEPAPWPKEDLEKAVGPMQTCAFCDQLIPADELFGMTLYDASNRLSGGRGMWMHLSCLNSRLHHKHAVINLKFDPNNMPE